MRELRYSVSSDCAGLSVQNFARRIGLSSSTLIRQKHLKNGILRNGIPCRSIDILSAGDILTFRLPEEDVQYPAAEGKLTVLWESEDYLVVDKGPFMPVHPSPGHGQDSLLNAVAYYCLQKDEHWAFRPLYRLDKDTSGIVVIGKHRPAVSSAVLQKRYYALCEGVLSGTGTIDTPIGLQPGSRIVREAGHGEKAVTHWRAVMTEGNITLLELRLETGRTHQIRVHLSHIGHPLAGDDLYGGKCGQIGRQALHCGKVLLDCPALSVHKLFVSEFPEDLCAVFPWLSFIKLSEQDGQNF